MSGALNAEITQIMKPKFIKAAAVAGPGCAAEPLSRSSQQQMLPGVTLHSSAGVDRALPQPAPAGNWPRALPMEQPCV